uniref:Bifunctional NAD(P)H-hydrate repair enzyme n=1 Tax=candidate division WOR-3 bacterium TaxID=2052148 RepID=A0A7C4YGF8_UNCW3
MKVLSVQESREIDRYVIEEIGIPGIVLMENAGLSVFEMIREYFETDKLKKVLIVAGKGNNGGDGFVVARHFFNEGCKVSLILLCDKEDLKGDALTEFKIIQKLGIDYIRFKKMEELNKEIESSDIIVDAIFGTGFKGKPDNEIKEIIKAINESGKPVFSIDIPSCVDGDNGNVEDVAVKAIATCTMGFIKKGLLFYPGREYAGEIYIGDIGIPEKCIEKFNIKTELIDYEIVKNALPQRKQYSHKGTYGKVIVFAGSPGLTGAATLTSISALKSGSGLVYLATPLSLNHIYEEKLTEVVKIPVKDEEGYYVYSDKIDEILNDMDVVILGPGIGRREIVQEFVRELIKKDKPFVIDADGINNLTLKELEYARGKWILTPHPGEFSRLTGISIKEIEKNRIEIANEFSKKYNLYLVLKGVPTVISTPDGRTFINSSGNSGLSSGGSGDVLTGMIGGFLAQGAKFEDAAICGVYLHGLAADIAIEENETEYSLTASSLIDYIGKSIKSLENAC